jgi:putative transposase
LSAFGCVILPKIRNGYCRKFLENQTKEFSKCKSRCSDSKIMTILKLNESGVSVPDLCCEHGMSAAVFYKWRAKFGGMDASMMKRRNKMYVVERLKAEIRQKPLRGSYNAISTSRDGEYSGRTIRRQCSLCVALLRYQRGELQFKPSLSAAN